MRPYPPNIPKKSGRRPFDRTALAFWVAFLVRVAYLTLAHYAVFGGASPGVTDMQIDRVGP